MKKMAALITAITVTGSVMASFSWAKVSDFNSLINENISAQQELQGEIRKQVKTTGQAFRQDLEKREASTVVVENEQSHFNSPTSKNMLRFKREKKQKTVSHKKQMDRISQEFNDASSSL